MKDLLRIPGLIDTHVHFRDPGETHKEDFYTGTRAAISGGVLTTIDMPNNREPIVDLGTLAEKEEIAGKKAVCDYGFYLGATRGNAGRYGAGVFKKASGLKMYLDQTHGPLLISDQEDIERHLHAWPRGKPILVHAEAGKVSLVLNLVKEFPRQVHFCHISLKEEIERIKEAKEAGLPVTCEVTPHHLFLTQEDEAVLGSFGRMKPPLRMADDVDALWHNLGVVDTIASDHAPHTVEEKLSTNPPFGVPGVETTLPLLSTAVAQGRLSLERMVQLTSTNPARIFGLVRADEDYVEVDLGESYIIERSCLWTKCGWSPFEGKKVVGRVRRAFLRGEKVYEDGEILVEAGFGKEVNQ